MDCRHKKRVCYPYPQVDKNISFSIKCAVLDIFTNGIDVLIYVNGEEYKSVHLDGSDLNLSMKDGRLMADQAYHLGSESSINRRDAIVVLGMHRSGTSVFAVIISLAGAILPVSLMPLKPDNPTGY